MSNYFFFMLNILQDNIQDPHPQKKSLKPPLYKDTRTHNMYSLFNIIVLTNCRCSRLGVYVSPNS